MSQRADTEAECTTPSRAVAVENEDATNAPKKTANGDRGEPESSYNDQQSSTPISTRTWRRCRTPGSRRFSPIVGEGRPPRPPTRRGLFPPAEPGPFDVHTSSDDERDLETLIAIETRIARMREYLHRRADEMDEEYRKEREQAEKNNNEK